MSKIAIKGAATGTGTFTLESPATNTNRTLTIPDVDGSIVTANASGNLGLGVTPSAWQSTSSSRAIQFNSSYLYGFQNSGLYIGNNAYFDGSWKHYASSVPTTRFDMYGAFAWQIAAAGTAGNAISFTQAMTLGADGVLQVGRSNGTEPDGKIQVRATGTGAGAANTKLGFALIEDDSGRGAGLWLGARTDENTGVIGSRTASGNIAFQTYNGSWGERMRITSAGLVGIGITSPTFGFDLRKNQGTNVTWGRNIANLVDGETNNTGLRIASNVSTSGLTHLIAATDSAASQFGFWTYNGSAWGERARIDTSGHLIVPNGITLGTAAGTYADANTLDDYEEGTWTPSVGGTATYYGQTGTYTKIGNVVYIRGNMHINAIGTGSATTISGFPFIATGGDAINLSYFGELNSSVYWLNLYSESGGASILNRGQTDLDATASSGLSLYKNGSQIVFSGVIKV